MPHPEQGRVMLRGRPQSQVYNRNRVHVWSFTLRGNFAGFCQGSQQGPVLWGQGRGPVGRAAEAAPSAHPVVSVP